MSLFAVNSSILVNLRCGFLSLLVSSKSFIEVINCGDVKLNLRLSKAYVIREPITVGNSFGYEHGLELSEQFAIVWLKVAFSARLRRNG